MGAKVRDLIQLEPDNRRWDFELLKIGRHFRYDPRRKVVLGRREEDNRTLQRMFDREDARDATLLIPDNFTGPAALLTGPADDESLQFAAGLVLRFSRALLTSTPYLRVLQAGSVRTLLADPPKPLSAARC